MDKQINLIKAFCPNATFYYDLAMTPCVEIMIGVRYARFDVAQLAESIETYQQIMAAKSQPSNNAKA